MYLLTYLNSASDFWLQRRFANTPPNRKKILEHLALWSLAGKLRYNSTMIGSDIPVNENENKNGLCGTQIAKTLFELHADFRRSLFLSMLR